MAHQVPWDASFNSKPVLTDKVGQGFTQINNTRKAVRERIAQEHNCNTSDSTTNNHGKHLEGSARAFISETAITDPSIMIETAYAESGNTHAQDFKNGRMYFNPVTKKFYVYVNSYVHGGTTENGFLEVIPTVAESCSGNAATATIAANATNADHATNADYATNATNAINAGHATIAANATNADHATNADYATNAGHAQNAGHAERGDVASSVMAYREGSSDCPIGYVLYINLATSQCTINYHTGGAVPANVAKIPVFFSF